MDDKGGSRTTFSISSRKVFNQARDAMADTAIEAVKKSPKTFTSFINLLHMPYLPLIAHHGKTGWLINYVIGPYNTV